MDESGGDVEGSVANNESGVDIDLYANMEDDLGTADIDEDDVNDDNVLDDNDVDKNGTDNADNSKMKSDVGGNDDDLFDDVLTSANKSDAISSKRKEENVTSNNTVTPKGNALSSIATRRYQLYVGNLTWWTTDQDVLDVISDLGLEDDFIEIKFHENRANGQSKGFALLSLASEKAMRDMLEQLPKKELHGQTPVVTYATKQALVQFDSQAKTNRPSQGQGERGSNASSGGGGGGGGGSNAPSSGGHGSGSSHGGGHGGGGPSMRHGPQPPLMASRAVPLMRARPPMPLLSAASALAAAAGLPFGRPPPPGLLGAPPIAAGPPLGGLPPPMAGLPLRGPPIPPPALPTPPGPPPALTRPPPVSVPASVATGLPAPHFNPAVFPQGPPPTVYSGTGAAPPLSEAEFEEIMGRNRTVSSSAIARAVQDAANGEFGSAIETLVTAISLIKQSKVAHDDRCRILVSSLQDTLHGIENKSYGARRRERSRSRERYGTSGSSSSSRVPAVPGAHRRQRSYSREREYRDRSRERDHHYRDYYRDRSRSRERDSERREYRREDRYYEDRDRYKERVRDDRERMGSGLEGGSGSSRSRRNEDIDVDRDRAVRH